MKIVKKAADIGAREEGRSRAVVMTMGALHDGHLSLVREARAAADEVVATIFVNPLQFNDPADLERYPRTLEADAALLEAEGVDVLYAPDDEDVYPGGEPVVTVSAGRLGEIFEGKHRPGHFDGMLTVVLKLLNLTQPDVAIFGQKDAQQLIAIRRMVRDFNVQVTIQAAATVREPDGLALSSRNRFLSASERRTALTLSGALMEAVARAEAGENATAALAAGYVVLAANDEIELDYFAALDPASGESVPSDYRGDVIFAVAASVGKTRFIDNMIAAVSTPTR